MPLVANHTSFTASMKATKTANFIKIVNRNTSTRKKNIENTKI
jgi:hypothetical protein